ncbi:MAG TPA: protein-L-isoaspartate(D-aspartate) O-methyltransferase [Synergistaceae bacterium]|nr:protein-L-isoaspartate(D-aspartate) O-methyltransferase [Synergistaceae bacterium]
MVDRTKSGRKVPFQKEPETFPEVALLDNWEAEAERMVLSQIEARGIRDDKILKALRSVPRHCFVPAHLRKWAYQDSPLPLDEGQTISQPYMVALMTSRLEVKEGMKVLEIGTGSGYQAALLACMGAEVHSIERIASLARSSSKILEELGYPVRVYHGDGINGLPEEAPFDRVLVTAAAPSIPPAIMEQTSSNAKVVIPIRFPDGNERLLTRIIDEEGYRDEWGEYCRFVPLLDGIVER